MEDITYRALLSVTIQAAGWMSYLFRERIEAYWVVPNYHSDPQSYLTSITTVLYTIESYQRSNVGSGLISAPDGAAEFIEVVAEAFMKEWEEMRSPYSVIGTHKPYYSFSRRLGPSSDDFYSPEITAREFCSLLIAIANQISQSQDIKAHISTLEKSHDTKRQSQATKIILWLIKARRALTVDELLMAISVDQGPLNVHVLNLLDKAIFEECWGLVHTTNDTVSFIYKDLKRYLLQEPIVSTGSNLELTITCITFLLYDIFSQGACNSTSSFDDRCHLYPFLLHVAPNLSFHLKECGKDLPMGLVLRFLDSPGSMSSYWQALYRLTQGSWPPHIQFPEQLIQPPEAHITLYVAAALGIRTMVQQLLEGIEVTSLEDNGWGLVFTVSFWGDKAVLELLVEVGIDTSVADFNGVTVLHLAAASGDISAVLLLLESNASISARDNKRLTVLYLAAIGGHNSVVSLILEGGAEVSVPDNMGEMALHKAAFGGHDSVVSLLLGRGAGVLIPDSIGETALHKAVTKGHIPVIFLLLNHRGLFSITIIFGGSIPVNYACCVHELS